MASSYTAPEDGTYLISSSAGIVGSDPALVRVDVSVAGTTVRTLDQKWLDLTVYSPQTVGGVCTLVLTAGQEVSVVVHNEDPTNGFEIIADPMYTWITIVKVGERP